MRDAIELTEFYAGDITNPLGYCHNLRKNT